MSGEGDGGEEKIIDPTKNRRERWLRNKGRDSITANWTRRDGISVLGANGITACFERLSNQGRRR